MLISLVTPLIIACSSEDSDSKDSGIKIQLTKDNLTDDGYFDGILYYKITSNSPREVMVNKAEESAISVEIPSSVNIDGIDYKCTIIGEKAFYSHKKLKTITIPNNVTAIGRESFYECSGLTSVTIPGNVTSIDFRAFCGCSGLTSVFIENGVTSIGGSAFSDCSRLTSVTIPNSVKIINDAAFKNCFGLTSVTIGNGVTSIGRSAFYGCSSLTSVTISDVAEWCKIDFLTSYSNPLYYAHHLYLNEVEITDLIIPNGVTSIGSAFSGCTSLTSVTIPNSVTSIGSGAFVGCTGLTSVTIPNSVTSIAGFSGCTSLTSVSIPNSVTSIGYYAFEGCTGLTSVTIPNSVISIDSYAFSGCTGLTSVTIPNSVISIDSYAFSGCTGLTSVTIPNSVTWIGECAFEGCTNLSSIEMNTIESKVYDLPKENVNLAVSHPNSEGWPVPFMYAVQVSLTGDEFNSWKELNTKYSSTIIKANGYELNSAVLTAYRERYYKDPSDKLPVFIRLQAYLPNYEYIFGYGDIISNIIQIKVRAYETTDTDMRMGFERDGYGDDKKI